MGSRCFWREPFDEGTTPFWYARIQVFWPSHSWEEALKSWTVWSVSPCLAFLTRCNGLTPNPISVNCSCNVAWTSLEALAKPAERRRVGLPYPNLKFAYRGSVWGPEGRYNWTPWHVDISMDKGRCQRSPRLRRLTTLLSGRPNGLQSLSLNRPLRETWELSVYG